MIPFSLTPFEARQSRHLLKAFDHPDIEREEKVRAVSVIELTDRLPQHPDYLDRLDAFCDGLWLEVRSALRGLGCHDLPDYRRHLQTLIYHLAWAATDPLNDGQIVMPFHPSKYGKGSSKRASLSYDRIERLVNLLALFPAGDTEVARGGRWTRSYGFFAIDKSDGRPSQLRCSEGFLDDLAQSGLLPCPEPHDLPQPASKLGILRIRPHTEAVDDEPEHERKQVRLKGRKATEAESKLVTLNVLIDKARPRVQLRSYADYILSRQENRSTGRTTSVISDKPHRLYRVFNDRDGEGGRIWGSYFQRLRSKLRSRILMGGEPVSELDFCSFQPLLAYSLEGLPAPGSGDCYTVPGFDASYRELFKLVFTVSVGCEAGANPVNAIWYRAKERRRYPGITKIEVKEAHDAFWRFHSPIGSYRCSSAWRRLQFHESEIALKVIGQLVDEGIAVIPIHDGFVVQKRYETVLRASMEEAVAGMTAKPEIKKQSEI